MRYLYIRYIALTLVLRVSSFSSLLAVSVVELNRVSWIVACVIQRVEGGFSIVSVTNLKRFTRSLPKRSLHDTCIQDFLFCSLNFAVDFSSFFLSLSLA